MGVGKSTFAFTNSSITVDGGSTTINITRDNQSYSHKLSHGYGDIATLAVGTTSYTWKPTASDLTKFFQEVPAQKSRLIDVYLDTYNGSTKVGRDTHALTVTLSEATGRPTFSGFTISDDNAITQKMGILVHGKSSISMKSSIDAKYGATISNESWSVYGTNIRGRINAFSAFDDIGSFFASDQEVKNFTLVASCTDSRGFKSDEVNESYYISKYKSPHIDTFEVYRCNTSGIEDDSGTKAKVVIKGGWAAMKLGDVCKNQATLKVGYRVVGSTNAYIFQSISISDGSIDILQILNVTLNANTDYEFEIILTDDFSESISISEVKVSNTGNILYISADGKELVIGSENGGNVAIDSDSLDIRDGSTAVATFTKNDIELGKNSQNSKISFCNSKGYVGFYEINNGGMLYMNSVNGIALCIKAPGESGYSSKPYIELDDTNITINGSISYSDYPKKLWGFNDGVLYMNANHKVTLSEAITSQPHGIVTCWCYYENNAPTYVDNSYCFIPKTQVQLHPGKGVNCVIGGDLVTQIGYKYIYVNDKTITGYSNNSNGFLSYFVLYGVLGV